jgi:hypothetical protein
MILTVFTLFHVVLSLIGIAAGLVVLFGMINSKMLEGWTSVFLGTTAATSLTGFLFPFHGFEPSYVLAAVSVILLAFSYAARYAYHLRGAWRRTYAITALVALYLNVLVLIIQLYRKTPALQTLASTQTPVQLVVLAAFLVLASAATIRFRGNVYSGEAIR